MFVGVAAIGPLVVGWSHDAMYGSPLRSGYLAQDYLFSLSHTPESLALYPRLLMRAHTPLIFAGLLAATVLLSRQLRARQEARVRHVALSALGIVAVNYLLYLPYTPLPDQGVVRFVLPAFTALVVLFAGLLVRVSRALVPNPAGRLAVCVIPVAIVVGNAAQYMPHAMLLQRDQAHLRIAGHYLRDALPANAAIITRLQGAALAHYTNRLIVRFDALPPTALDAVVAELRRRGYHPTFVLAEETEANWVGAHFASSLLSKLDWPPRMSALGLMNYWDPADRESYARGIRWPTDVLR